ncbi:uncharacterized protein LOC132565485 [Ylistrum balloti]|uniref:uncharacterized protein LOC132565485 n=1 Tax=Ylistrum balloti TaxID=509963 RepID=UPI002905BB09|nr:uncharacterized protein LOC132565485 [Ylistrum balloti]
MIEPKDSERISLLLSKYIEAFYTGTPEEVYIRQRKEVLTEQLEIEDTSPLFIIKTGSRSEGLHMKGSDIDNMMVDGTVSVMYSDQCILPNMAENTILYIREGDCRPGYVNLELGKMGRKYTEIFVSSLVRVENSIFLSSDIYREELGRHYSTIWGIRMECNGPSSAMKASAPGTSTMTDTDSVFCFSCNNWPKAAREWITRPRLHGWPCQTLIDKIVQNGCHLVPVGDKCSENTLLQWRISFATAERSLVHSFSHIQFKLYSLLKYFLKQIKYTLNETVGDDDILCSYFLKTILFHAIEKTSQRFWQEKNLLYCFWFCFNILIAWVKAGFCPNYFIPVNNLFQRKIHGQRQQILLNLLKQYSQMKWMCLSVGSYFKPIWQSISDSKVQTRLDHLKPVWAIVLEHDLEIARTLPISLLTEHGTSKSFMAAMQSLSTSVTEFDEIYTHFWAFKRLPMPTNEMIHTVIAQNKLKYKRLRKCKHLMIPNAVMGTELLYLATLHFLMGAFSKSLGMSKEVMQLASYFQSDLSLHLLAFYTQECFRSRHAYERLQKVYTGLLRFHRSMIHLPHFSPEFLGKFKMIFIPPLPYALFLSFLCCHELGDTRGRDAALSNLKKVQRDKTCGGQIYWMVHTLLGICFHTLGNFPEAINAYWESARSQNSVIESNPAIYRIAVVYLCMYVSQRPDRS